MEILIDCQNGISGDMVLKALLDLSDKMGISVTPFHGETLGADKNHKKSYIGIKDYITSLDMPKKAKEMALRTYEVLAIAESEVHNETLETIHFHEVGRQSAIKNVIDIAMALHYMEVKTAYVGDIHDGCGTVICSHGEIPVPVPAVEAMKKHCNFVFKREEVNTELVSPRGLALLIAMEAKPNPSKGTKDYKYCGLGIGTRVTGRGGLKIYGQKV